ncbi:ankyrin repeat-containing domain protein [Xylariales sp. PMI_506]|nr:ankyrin repeat-containing domain protein [Xylariales sp. PMI_506]
MPRRPPRTFFDSILKRARDRSDRIYTPAENGTSQGSAAPTAPAHAVAGAGITQSLSHELATLPHCATTTQSSNSQAATDDASQQPTPQLLPTPPVPYANTHDLWSEAFEVTKNTEDGQKITPLIQCFVEASAPSPTQSPGSVASLAIDVQKKIEEALRAEKHDGKIRPIVENAVSVLDKFVSVGDVISSFDPVHAALPWAAVRSVVVVLVARKQLKSLLLSGIATATTILTQCETYQQLYMAPDSTLRPPESQLERLKESIVDAYSKIMLFLGFAKRTEQNKAIALTAALKMDNATMQVQSLSESEILLQKAADGCEKHCNLKLRRQMQNLQDLMRLSDYILQAPVATSSVVLWLEGLPGTGKTFLTSKVIDHVQNQLANSQMPEGFAFFYCNRNEEIRREPLSVLQSYVRQLASAMNHPGQIRKRLRDVCNEKKAKGSLLSFQTCKEELVDCINLYSRTTLVLDALDECEPRSRSKLIAMLEDLLSQSRKTLRVFISSRPERDIRKCFMTYPTIEIEATDNEEDIRKFVDGEVAKHGDWDEMSPALKKEIAESLYRSSDGMFQWVNMQIKEILDLEAEEAIRDRLGKLPNGLKATYEEIYEKIKKRHGADKVFADRAFMWVMAAKEPFSSGKILSAIRINPKGTPFLLSEITESKLLHLCNNLLVIDSQRGVWRFSHLSVREYFENSDSHWSQPQAHCYAAEVCLRLLLEPDSSQSSSESGGGIYSIMDLEPKFETYAHEEWAYHVHTQEDCEPDHGLVDKLKSFLGSPHDSGLQYRKWFSKISIYGYMERKLSPESRAIWAMCYFSLYNLLLEWWEMEELDLNQTNAAGDDLLSLAAEVGCDDICRLLLKLGAPVNRLLVSSECGSALAAAIQYRNTDTVRLLLEHGADPNLVLQSGDYGSALVAAVARYVDIDTVRLLLEHGADPNLVLQSGDYGSALVAAAAGYGGIDTVRLLLEHGADPNLVLQSGNYGSALATAIQYRNTDTVRLLLKHGADPNLVLQSGKYGSALATAIQYKNTDTVRLLLEHGADPNLVLQSGDYGSALATAAAAGYRDIDTVRLLLEHGADPNLVLQSGDYGSALVAAAAGYGGIDTVRLLLEHGADPNLVLQSGNYGSALATAIQYRNTDTVRLLLEHGADPNLVLQSGKYGSALATAIQYKNTDTVRLLLDHGADPNLVLQSGDYGSALATAAAAGYRDIDTVRLLLEHGADPNLVLQSGNYGSALAAAIQYKNTDTVRLLLEHGADPNLVLQSGNYGSALAAAIQYKNTDTVRLLLEHGADPNLVLQSGNYGSALAAAIQYKNTDTVRLLLEHGADPNLVLQSGNYGSALAAAIQYRNTDTVRLLLEHGADPNLVLQSGKYGSALATAAARYVDIDTVRLLLEHGADPNLVLQSGDYGSALAAAAIYGDISTVRLLLEHGADPNLVLKSGDYGSTLAAAAAAAAAYGNIDTVRLLLEYGADPNLVLKSGDYGSALAAAVVRYRNIDTVRLLLEHGADPNLVLQSGDYGSTLAAAAAAYGNIDTVRLLLDHGADPNLVLKSGDYGSALAAAAKYGYIDTVRLLLDHGADPNLVLQSGDYGSTLAAAAAAYGNIDTVRLLLEYGADPNLVLKSGDYGSALAAAVIYGDISTVRLLLEHGADPNLVLQSGDYGSALAAAARYGRADYIRLLITSGANINVWSHRGYLQNPLFIAAYWAWVDCVETLLEGGADVNCVLKDEPYQTALQAAKAELSAEELEEVLQSHESHRSFLQNKAKVEDIIKKYMAKQMQSHRRD